MTPTREVEAKDLAVGMVIVARRPGRLRYEVLHVYPNCPTAPLIIVRRIDTGELIEYDSWRASIDMTYSVER